MTEQRKNKLWAMLPTSENLSAVISFAHKYANPDHILIIAPDAPKGATELTEEDYALLQADDIEWLEEASEQIKKEQIKLIEQQANKELEEFMSRFETALRLKQEETNGNRKDTDN